MSKFLYLFIVLGLAIGAYSYAEEHEEMKCPEGMVYDKEAQTCVVAAEEDIEKSHEMKDEDRVTGDEEHDDDHDEEDHDD